LKDKRAGLLKRNRVGECFLGGGYFIPLSKQRMSSRFKEWNGASILHPPPDHPIHRENINPLNY